MSFQVRWIDKRGRLRKSPLCWKELRVWPYSVIACWWDENGANGETSRG